MVVLVDGSMLAAELNAQKIFYICLINKLIEDEYPNVNPIASITFKVSRKAVKKGTFSKGDGGEDIVSEVVEVPLDSNELKIVDETSNQLPSQKLQESFKRAMRAQMKRNKAERLSKRS